MLSRRSIWARICFEKIANSESKKTASSNLEVNGIPSESKSPDPGTEIKTSQRIQIFVSLCTLWIVMKNY